VGSARTEIEFAKLYTNDDEFNANFAIDVIV